MRLIGNVLWLVLSGFWMAVGYAVAGVIMCITIIGIPLGLANFKLVPLALWPFGKTVVSIDRVAGRKIWVRGPQPIG